MTSDDGSKEDRQVQKGLERLVVNYVDDLAGRVERSDDGIGAPANFEAAYGERNMFYNLLAGQDNPYLLKGIGVSLERYLAGNSNVPVRNAPGAISPVMRYVVMGLSGVAGGFFAVDTGVYLANGGDAWNALFPGAISFGLLYGAYRLWRGRDPSGKNAFSFINVYPGLQSDLLSEPDVIRPIIESRRDYIIKKLNLSLARSSDTPSVP